MTIRRIVERRDTVVSPWVTLSAKAVAAAPSSPAQWYHSIRQADYINVLALTPDSQIVLVRQFRPAIEGLTLEFPGGLREGDPAADAGRELLEETGFRAPAGLIHLGTLLPDTGRLENKLWCYFAGDVEAVAGWRAETGVERVLVPKDAFLRSVKAGEFNAALPIAILGLAFLAGRI